MKKLLAVAATTAFLAACGSNDTKVIECTYPDAPEVAAPLWVCDVPVPGVAVSAVGSADKSKAGPQFTKQMAIASARVQLATNMKTHVNNMIKQYAETTGAGDAETVDQVNTSVSKLITDETLVGTKPFRNITSPKGTIYVLVGMDDATAKAASQQVIQTSMGNDQALWQKFQADKAQEEMAAAIVNQ